MANRSDIRSDVRLELGDPGGSGPIWTDNELNRLVDEVTADFSRTIPQEKIQEVTIDFAVLDEGWNTSHGTAVSLANKPIELNSETVKRGFGSHLIFTGADGEVTIADASAIQNVFAGGGSIEVFIYVASDGEGNSGIIVGKGVIWSVATVSETGGEVEIKFRVAFSGTAGEWDAETTKVTLNAWTRVSITYDSDDVANNPLILFNGVSVTVTETSTPVGTATTDVGSDLFIGDDTGGDAFDGRIDDVRLWDDIRTVAEVAASDDIELLGTEAGLVGYWRLNEREGLIAQDATSNDNDGVIRAAIYGNTPVPVDDVAYTLDTDYTMDYANGAITALDSGSLATSVRALINYTKDRIALDLSSITDMVKPVTVETLVGSVPQSSSSFSWWAKILWILTRTGRGQERQGDRTHVRVYYHAEHTAPTDSANGTFPRFLDQVMLKGVVAYALFLRHRKLNLQADRESDMANTSLVSVQVARDRSRIALESLLTASTGPHAKVAAALGNITTPLAAIVTALDKVPTHVTEAGTALAKVTTHSGTEAAAALAKVDVHITTDAETALDAAATEAALANTALDKVDTHLAAAASSTKEALDDILEMTVFADADAALDKVTTYLDLVSNATTGVLHDAEAVWADEIKHILTAAGIPNMEDLIELGDDLINTVNLGADAAELYRRYALAAREMAQLWDQKRKDFLTEADKFNAEAVAYIQEALARLGQADRLIAEAVERSRLAQTFVNEAGQRNLTSQAYTAEGAQRIAMSLGFIEEAGQRNLMSLRFIEEAQQRIGMAITFTQEAAQRAVNVRLYLEEADRWLAKGQQYLDESSKWLQEASILNTQASLHLAVANQRALVSDRFLLDARERHNNYWELLMSRVQSARRRSTASPNQYVTDDDTPERVSQTLTD